MLLFIYRNRCTKAQVTCLVNYMQQNKDFAMSDPRDSSSVKKWRELESKLAKIGPWKSISHLKGVSVFVTPFFLQQSGRSLSIWVIEAFTT